MIVRFTVPGKPQPKQRARRGKGGRWYTPRETKAYEKHVGWACLAVKAGIVTNARGLAAYRGPWRLDLKLYFPDRRRRDADNVAKSIQDGLNGVLWADDSQVKQLALTVEVDRDNPRVEVEATSLAEAA